METRDEVVLANTDIERTLVVDIVRHAHQSVIALSDGLGEGLDVAGKLLVAEDGIDGGEDEGTAVKMGSKGSETVHRTGSGAHDIVEGQGTAVEALVGHLGEMGGDLGTEIVADHP